MDQRLFPEGTNASIIKDNLEGLAIKIENDVEYFKPLTPEENTILKDTLAECSIKQVALLRKFEMLKEEHKNMLAPLKQQWDEVVNDLRNQTSRVEAGKLYQIADEDTKQIGYYDETGCLIKMRTMLPEERKMLKLDVADTIIRKAV